MEENILLIIMAENALDQTPREILIDEGVRLSKSFVLKTPINLSMQH